MFSVPDRLWHCNAAGVRGTWNTEKAVPFWETYFGEKQDGKDFILFCGRDVMRLHRRDPFGEISGAYLPFLLVGLFQDTVTYHKIYIHTDERHVFGGDHGFHGCCTEASVPFFPKVERRGTESGGHSGGFADGRRFSL